MTDILITGSLMFEAFATASVELTLAYVGPAGIGTLGVLLVVVLVLLVGAVGLVLYPVRLLLSYRRSAQEQIAAEEAVPATVGEQPAERCL